MCDKNLVASKLAGQSCNEVDYRKLKILWWKSQAQAHAANWVTEWQEKKGLFRGLSFSSEGGPQICEKVVNNKIATLYFGNKNFMSPITTHTPYPLHRLKFWLPSPYILVTGIQSFYDSPYFPQNLWSPSIFGTPLLKKMTAPYIQHATGTVMLNHKISNNVNYPAFHA